MKFSVMLSTVCATIAIITILSPHILVHAQESTSCTEDYECGIPYGYCAGSSSDCSSTFQGIAVDQSSGEIYYVASCSSGSSLNVSIKKVSASGGPATTIYTEVALQEGGNVGKALQVENGLLYVSRIERAPGQELVTVNLQSGAQNTVTLNPGFFESELDIRNGNSYSCQLAYGTSNDYTIQRYSGVVGQTTTTANGYQLYSLGSSQCGPLRRGTGTDIIFTQLQITPEPSPIISSTSTIFYKGIVTGGASLPSPYFVVANATVYDFVVDFSTGAIIYGSSSGLFIRSAKGETKTLYSASEVTGVALYNNRIYFNDGTTIRSINEDGTDDQKVVQQTEGTCKCVSQFTGSDCQSCSGQVQWSNTGVPSCVSINGAGIPEYCTYDYQCGNVPYTFCEANTCECRQGFTGPNCEECASSVTWSNGIPSCA